MKYTIKKLQEEKNQGIKRKHLYFWGHQPNRDGSIGKSCLSQWWEQSFQVEGNTYPTAEHWMMAGKARLFEDQEILAKILISKHPHEAKKLGRQVRNFDQPVWEKHRYDIVLQGNVHKFGQHPALKTFLLNTKNSIIVEASPVDKIWGIGLKGEDPRAARMEQWEGLNLLGFVLMEVRDGLV